MKYLLEQVEDVAVVQYYADGFAELPLDQKILAWHLYQAAIAGRDIYYDQRYAHALDMRRTLEAILRANPPDSVTPEPRTANRAPRTGNHEPGTANRAPRTATDSIRAYTKLFWINSGPHNNLTSRKFVLKCAPAEFRAAAHDAEARGAEFPTKPGETLDQLLDRLEGPFFDPAVDPFVTSKAPADGRDILEASANNHYDGVTMADLEGFAERHPLNSRLVKRDGRLVEEVCRLGGRYGDLIARITGHLRAALPYAPAPTREALDRLIRFYETGDDADRQAYDIAWVQDADAPVDTINGFVENYLDARGVKGSWEALVYYVNERKTESLRRLAEAAAWFEARMPWDPQWRRPDVVGVTAKAIDVVVETGEAGPVTAIGINLPNDQRVRERYGSKSVSLANINEAYEKSQLPAYRKEFCWTPEEVARAERWGAVASEATTAIHEVLGHGSGRVATRFDGQPQLALKEQYSALEEARADLVALYWVADPKVAEIGLVPAEHHDEIVRTEYEAYARNALVQLRRMREGTTIEEDHMRNRQMIVHWLLAHTRAIDRHVRDDRTFYVVVDFAAFRDGCGRLLHDVQRIKSEGDYAAARALFEAHGIHFDPALRDEIVRRVDRLNLPSYTGFVQPTLEPVIDAAGTIAGVRISYPQDLERQMLDYSGLGARLLALGS